jgi:4-amino-4-deoxy-L-arabinose transferase-like glycosyltransferase
MKGLKRYILLFVLVVALALRLGFAVGVAGLDSAPGPDEARFHALAVSIAEEAGYLDASGRPTGLDPPGYPAFLSGLYRLFGPGYDVARIAQAVLGVLVVLLVFSIARRHFGAGAALVAATITALDPLLVGASGTAHSGTLYTVTMLYGLRVLPRPSNRDGDASRGLFGAVILALAALVQSPGLAMAVAVGLGVLLLARGDVSMRVAQTTLLALVLAAVLLPWAFRNQTTFGRWVGLSTGGGVSLYQGNNPRAAGDKTPPAELPHWDSLSRLDEGARDREARRLALAFVRENRGDLPRLAWRKLERFWRWDTGTFATIHAGIVFGAVTLPLVLVGLFVTRRQWRELLYYYAVVIVHVGYAVVFFGEIRGRIPVEPVIAVFAAAAVTEPLKRMRERRARDASSD